VTVAAAPEMGMGWEVAGLGEALSASPLAPLDPSAEAVLALVVRRLDARIDLLAEAICRCVHEQVPEYGALGVSRGQLDLSESVRRTARLGLRVLAHGGAPTAEELVLLQAIGAARAVQGLPLDGMLAGLRLACWLGWSEIVGQVRELPLAEANISVLGTLALRLFTFAGEAAAALAAGHAANRQRGRRRDLERAELFDRLLSGAFASDDDMVRDAARFGHDLTAAHGLLLLTGRDRSVLRAGASAVCRQLPGAVAAGHRGGPCGHVAVIVPCADAAAWRQAVDAAAAAVAERDLTVVAVAPVSRPARIAAAYRDAADGAPLAAALFRRARVVDSDDLLAHRALRRDGPDRRRFVERTLGPLLALPARHAEPLLETMETLFAHGGAVEATHRALGVHDKTIRYRIRRIREVTGLCPLRDRGRLELALMLHRLDAVED